VSWDFTMVIDTGGPEPAQISGCWTSWFGQVVGICSEALGRGTEQLDGLSGREALPLIEAALAKMRTPKGGPLAGRRYFFTAKKLLETLARWCRDHPNALIDISR